MQNASSSCINGTTCALFHRYHWYMNMYLYVAGNPGYAEKLLSLIDTGMGRRQDVILLPADFPGRTFLDFNMHSGDVLILAPADGHELEQLLAMNNLLRDFRLILILPDSSPETVARGHTLMPRYLASIDRDLHEVVGVLGRMIAP